MSTETPEWQGTNAPDWVQAVLPEEIGRQRAMGWPDFHPEDFCHRCGRRNPVWSGDLRDWRIATEQRPRGVLDILCPSWIRDAAERGVVKLPLGFIREGDTTREVILL
jgi:hypothetical protein